MNLVKLDLFAYNAAVYEGQTGLRVCSVSEAERLSEIIARNGGMERMEQLIAESIQKNGLSPRYARPDELKKEVFPPKEKDENLILAKDLYDGKHYYFRFHHENGIELYTQNSKDEYFQTVYVRCEGYMVGIDQKHRLDEILKWLPTLENGIKGELKNRFNESMAHPERWADLGYAAVLGRVEEAKAHNVPIREERERQDQQERTARAEQERAEEIRHEEEYRRAIAKAEQDILGGSQVLNTDIQGKSLIMQLFREHEITVPLKTQGWIVKSLHSIYSVNDSWNYRYYKTAKDSTVFGGLLDKLTEAVKTKEQFNAAGQDLGNDFQDLEPPAEGEGMEI